MATLTRHKTTTVVKKQSSVKKTKKDAAAELLSMVEEQFDAQSLTSTQRDARYDKLGNWLSGAGAALAKE